MKILAFEKELPTVTEQSFEEYEKAEAKRIWELYVSGVLREMHFRADRDEAVLMLECENVKKAGEILETLPFVQKKLITFDLVPLRPYPGFARLFK